MKSSDNILERLIEENITVGIELFKNMKPQEEEPEKSWPESDTFWEELDIINL